MTQNLQVKVEAANGLIFIHGYWEKNVLSKRHYQNLCLKLYLASN